MAYLHFQKDACSLMHTGILPGHMPMCHTYAVFSRARGGIRSLETGVTDGCESPCGGWKSNPAPPEEEVAL